jgi:hypothetical protein
VLGGDVDERGQCLVAEVAAAAGRRQAGADPVKNLAVLVPNLKESAAAPEALLTGRVLDDSVERDVLADHDLSHFGSTCVGVVSSLMMSTTATSG